MVIESSEGEMRNRLWYGVFLANGTTVALALRGSLPWESLVGP
jgi:hypothetical protein